MRRILTSEIPDEIYDAIEQAAAQDGLPVGVWVSRYLSRHLPGERRGPSDEQRQAAIRRFEECLGSVSLGHPTGLDNQSIDRDLAREYGNEEPDRR